ncbi:MAG: efflux RND transporter periplasmic adaptor subunit [Chloracidobacterium sp.]
MTWRPRVARYSRPGRHPAVWPVQMLLLIATLLTAVGCQKTTETRAAAPASDAPSPVQVARVQARQRPQTIGATGSVVALRQSAVAPMVAGHITSVAVDVGDLVSAGQPILRLDDREAHQRLAQARAAVVQAEAAEAQLRARLALDQSPFDPRQTPEAEAARAELAAAEADAQLAAATLARYERLARNDNITRAALDEARTNVEKAQSNLRAARRRYEALLQGLRAEYAGLRAAQSRLDEARAQVALAEKAVEDTTVRAPFAGCIAERLANPGEFASPDKPVVVLVALERVKLELRLPETSAARIRLGQEVDASVEAHPGLAIRGKVTAIRPVVEAATRMVVVDAIVANTERKLRPGMFVTAQIGLGETVSRLVVPSAAVWRHPTLDAFVVFVVEDNRARLRLVQVGESLADEVEVYSGVSQGERVIVSDPKSVVEGREVLCSE